MGCDMALTAKQRKQLKEYRRELYFKNKGRCQNCGRPISQYEINKNNYGNFIHTESAHGRSFEDTLKRQFLGCFNLHVWQNDKPGNLENDPCVLYFKKHYYIDHSHRNFYKKFIKNKGLFEK